MPSHSHRVTFRNIKLHLSIGLRKCKAVKIFLHNKTVLQRMNVHIQDTNAPPNRRAEVLILSGKLPTFIKIKKRIGPKTDTWGKLDKTGTGPEA